MVVLMAMAMVFWGGGGGGAMVAVPGMMRTILTRVKMMLRVMVLTRVMV